MNNIRLNIYTYIFLILLLSVNWTSAQSNNSGFYGNSKASGEVCSQNGSFMSESEVNNLVTEMLSLIGAKNRYVIVACEMYGLRHDSYERYWLLDVIKPGMGIKKLAKFWLPEDQLNDTAE